MLTKFIKKIKDKIKMSELEMNENMTPVDF